ncbi:MAG: glycosyltransferase family 9 protein, partial [Desulfobacterales bacterium]|nr:glycosyltransferase family 9 protein [Desulfobacterales bacterium]
ASRFVLMNMDDFEVCDIESTGQLTLEDRWLLSRLQKTIEDIRNGNRQVYKFDELTDLADGLESAGGYIGNDSGVSQLAAFLGVASVVFFGPADPVRWKPVGPRVQIVRPELDCSPCFEIEAENCDQPACLSDATVESVLKAWDQVYQI